jgi:hypothetical protein
MGRISQIFWFLQAEKAPSPQELRHHYSHLDVDDDLRKLGRELRTNRTDSKKLDSQSEPDS